MEGRPLAERIRAQVAEDVRELGAIGLATVQVGEDEASTIYLRLKHKAASEVEIGSVDRKLPLDASFRWHEYEIFVHHLPGHTLYAAAYEFEVDRSTQWDACPQIAVRTCSS